MDNVITPALVTSPNTLKSPISVIRDVLVHQMELEDSRVNIYNQKFKMPTDDGLFVVLSFVGAKPYRVMSENYVEGNSFAERQKINVQEIYDISILSRDESAMFRKEEILFALVSQYCLQKQELYNFKIARIPQSFNDISEVEASARLYRFSLNIVVLAWYTKESTGKVTNDFYDKFNGVVHTERIEVPFEQPVPQQGE